ncbi:MAG: Uma2 family endonuclease [Leptospirales bacterium]
MSPLGEVFAAPCDVVFSADPLQVVEPDLLFVSKEHLSLIGEKNIQGVPDLLVEILSPSPESSDRRVKHSLYERFGVSEYWIVDPEKNTVQAVRLVDGHYPVPLEPDNTDALLTPLLPGSRFPCYPRHFPLLCPPLFPLEALFRLARDKEEGLLSPLRTGLRHISTFSRLPFGFTGSQHDSPFRRDAS